MGYCFHYILTFCSKTVLIPNRKPFAFAKRLSWQTQFICNRSQSVNYSTESKNPLLFKMKIESPQFHALFTPEMKDLISIFKRNDHELRIAGGAVRDLLMHKKPHDVDFATTATPVQMKEIFTRENIRMLNRKGEGHGTVAVRINDKEDFELTTLRIDVDTDGRHAKVEFTTDWRLDASRRDFTINAMFLGLDGTVYDYFNGIEDLDNRKIRFVGDVATRIRQDYLRILRYFRFYGRVAEEPNNHDPEILKTISANASGLENISGQKIWTEWKKLLTGNFKYDILKTMLNIGLGPALGLPANSNIKELDIVCNRTRDFDLHPITMFASLLRNESDMKKLHSRLKFSSFERDLGYFIVTNNRDKPPEDLVPYQTLMLESKRQADTREWIEQLLSYYGNTKLLEQFKDWKVPKFPISGHDILSRGIKRGQRFNNILIALKKRWISSNFLLSAEKLLENFDDVVREVDQQNSHKIQN